MPVNEGIQISTQVLLDTSEKVRSINRTLDLRLADINKAMNDIEVQHNSSSGREIRSNMNAMKPRFDQYNGVVESYCKFLVDTAQKVESVEQTLTTNASQFKQ